MGYEAQKIAFIAMILAITQSLSASAEDQYGKDIKERKLEVPTCSKPLATIVARGFKCKAAQCSGSTLVFGPGYTIDLSPKALGDGLSDMLVTALVKTGCFKVLERGVMEELKEELGLLGVKPQQALQGADILLTGAITALEVKASETEGGGIVVPLPFIGGLKLSKSSAHIGLDIRLIHIRTQDVISAKSVEGKSERWKTGVVGGGLIGEVFAGGLFNTFKNTPLEEATRDLIVHAVALIVEDVRAYIAKNPFPKSSTNPTVSTQTTGDTASSPQLKPSTEGVASNGGLQRKEVAFVPGNTLIWQEDFSKCDLIPTGFKIVKGNVECVSFGGKKWITGVKGDTVVEKEIPNWDLSKDWALEFDLYISEQFYGDSAKVFIGIQESPYQLKISGGDWHEHGQWSGKPLPDIPKPAAKSVHHVAIQKKGDTFIIFFNGKRIFTTTADVLSLSRSQKSLFFTPGYDQADISAGRYVLVTNIRLTQY